LDTLNFRITGSFVREARRGLCSGFPAQSVLVDTLTHKPESPLQPMQTV
jgi:hypothetical protein